MKLFRRTKDTETKTPAFVFCESVTAGPMSRNHIRPIDENGLKLGGGATTESLCGRDLNGGWDLPGEVTVESVATLTSPRAGDGRVFVCLPCAEIWQQIAE